MLVAAFTTAARADEATAAFQYQVVPYLWMPTVNGQFTYRVNTLGTGENSFQCRPTCTFGVEVGPNSYVSNLNFSGGISASARWRAWGVNLDVLNVNFGAGSSAVKNVDSQQGFEKFGEHPDSTTLVTGMIDTVTASHHLGSPSVYVTSALLGVRITAVTAETQYSLGDPEYLAHTGQVSKEVEPTDLIVGVEGRRRLNDLWYVPYYLDVGAGTNSSTWQGLLGIGCGRKASLLLAYRNLSYSSSSRQYTNSGDAFTSANFSGPLLSYTLQF